ncbi:MAG: STAS domain-containing protein [Steroidobacteraceae bacterium]
MSSPQTFASVLQQRRQEILQQWLAQLAQAVGTSLKGRLSEPELARQAGQFLDCLLAATRTHYSDDINAAEWKETRDFLEELSRERVQMGFSADETAIFIFSLKRPLFDALRERHGTDALKLAADVWDATALLDKLGLYTIRAYQKTRESVINRQQQELLELSTPVVKLWEGILALPMIGTLDSARTQIVMESLLQKIVETESQIAIIDITGVPTVDTLVAQHLLKTVTALRLMGADCIISGVRPQIAQTIVHLGVDLQGVTTKANLADALALALKRTGAALGK